MTEQIKNSFWKMLEFIPKAITPALLVIIIWQGGKYMQRSEDRQFPSPAEKTRTLDHVANSLSAEQLIHLRTHIENGEIHMDRDYKDSLYLSKGKGDTIYQLVKANAITSWQTKKELQELNNKIEVFMKAKN